MITTLITVKFIWKRNHTTKMHKSITDGLYMYFGSQMINQRYYQVSRSYVLLDTAQEKITELECQEQAVIVVMKTIVIFLMMICKMTLGAFFMVNNHTFCHTYQTNYFSIWSQKHRFS